MERAITAMGGFPLPRREPSLHLLCASVIGQSISTAAAARIVERFTALAGGPATPDAIRRLAVEDLRAIGLTLGKADALRGLADVWDTEGWADRTALRRASDSAIMEALCAVKGVGPWTAKMFLIFGLRRPDVLPQEDLGIRVGLGLLDGRGDRPSAGEVLDRGEAWRPWRTVASVALWQWALRAKGASLDEGGWWNAKDQQAVQ